MARRSFGELGRARVERGAARLARARGRRVAFGRGGLVPALEERRAARVERRDLVDDGAEGVLLERALHDRGDERAERVALGLVEAEAQRVEEPARRRRVGEHAAARDPSAEERELLGGAETVREVRLELCEGRERGALALCEGRRGVARLGLHWSTAGRDKRERERAGGYLFR